MRIHRTLSKCNKCPLRDQRRVWGEGPLNPDLVIIGEAPGRQEAEKGVPFFHKAKAGKCLNIHLSAAGIMRHRCYVMNVIPCRPPNNDINHPDAFEAIKLCHAGFYEELTKVTKNCNTILTLGNVSLQQLIDTEGDGIMKVRGSVYDYIDTDPVVGGACCHYIIIPTYHPSFLVRQVKNVKTLSVYRADLRKAKRISEGGRIIYPQTEYKLNPEFEEIIKFLKTTRGKLIAADTENDSKDPMKANLICLSFATSHSQCTGFRWQKQGGGPYWTPGQENVLIREMSKFVKGNQFMFQNTIYDKRVLDRHDIVIPYENIKHDTMILHHVLNPELLHNIGFIGSLYADTPYHKGVLLNRRERIIDMDPIRLGTYNCDDSTILHKVLPGMLHDLEEDNLTNLYENERMKLIKPYVRMMDRGIRLDKKVHKEWVKEKETHLIELEKELRNLADLPEEFNFSADDDLRFFLFNTKPSRVETAERALNKRLEKIERYKSEGKEKQVAKLEASNVHKDLLSKVNFVNHVKPIYILTRYNGRKTKKSNKQSVSAENLLELRNQLNRRLEAIHKTKIWEDNFLYPSKEIQRNTKLDDKRLKGFIKEEQQIRLLLTWLIKLSERTRVNTLISNYGKLHTHIMSDDRIHPNFNIIGTRTGRPSCSDPNLLTLPKKRDRLLRKAFIPAKGFRFLSGDYTGAEIVAFSYITGNEKAIEAIKAGKNIHDENTKLVFGINESDPEWKQKRDIVKQFRFGRIQYGGSDAEIFRKILIDCPELEMTFGQFKQLSKDYFKANPEEKEWIEKQQEYALKYRMTETPMGFKRRLYGSDSDIKKQAINTPVQGMVAHVINRAMIDIEDALEERGTTSRMVLQIYDQLVFEEWPDEVDMLRPLVKNIMERPVDIYGREVVFKVDMAVGDNFGDLKEIKYYKEAC